MSKLEKSEAIELCQMLQLPVITALQTLRSIDFDAVPGNLGPLGRWYGVVNDDCGAPLQVSEGSHKAVATHKLSSRQLHAFRELRRAISRTPCSVLLHMPFGAGKLRLVATAVIDFYRSEADDRSVIWLAPGAAMCEEAFSELKEVWQQLGSRDITILQLYGNHPTRDLDQLGGAIAVVDILQLSQESPALETLGSITSVVVLADAENIAHPAGANIIRKMSVSGTLSVVGILATSGAAIPPGPARDSLKGAFLGGYISVSEENELQQLRKAGNFADIETTVVPLTTSSVLSTSTNILPPAISDDSLDFDQMYVNELATHVERNQSLLEILKKESTGRGRIVYYATTAANARLFAGLLPVLGVKARSVTAEESPEERTLALQKFVARDDERILCVHGFLLSGDSVPNISVCVMASPSKSRAVFLSTIGRLVQARDPNLPTLRLIVASDSQADTGWVTSINTWSTLDM
ncbi:DEAD/DEAH box helicase [Andreprevotia sp. IGB-42]|uniref:DEAD/DEAH box helicase n=1 Tax=Andreprevotia sp. IGB-42 TaxID=2497473 RepID=UPI001356A95F|nr:hypothetical protein [Andreprevotia sp. IGB-42]